jgi:uncharacterized protein (TIGR02145 family)
VTQATCVGGILSNECPAGFSKGGANAPSSSSSSIRQVSSSSSAGVHGALVYGGKTYKTVKIGEHTWMAENLNYNAGGSSASGVRCYNGDTSLCDMFGRLYNWSTAMNIHSNCDDAHCTGDGQHRGICPSGWHIPGKAEWDALAAKAGGVKDAGKHLKAVEHWNKYNGKSGNGDDAYNFLGLPGGFYADAYDGIDFHGYWWSADEDKSGSSNAGSYSMHYSNDSLVYKVEVKSSFFSVRCVQD